VHFFGFSPWKSVKQAATSFIKVEAITSLDGVEKFSVFTLGRGRSKQPHH
jgi:hypothetical protein